MSKKSQHSIDKKWQFAIAAFGFAVFGFSYGSVECSGVLFYEYQHKFNANAVQASTLGSILYGSLFLFGKYKLRIKHFNKF